MQASEKAGQKRKSHADYCVLPQSINASNAGGQSCGQQSLGLPTTSAKKMTAERAVMVILGDPLCEDHSPKVQNLVLDEWGIRQRGSKFAGQAGAEEDDQ